MNEALEALIRELDRVGSLNGDEFDVKIHAKLDSVGLYYDLDAFETAENHPFVGGSGRDIETAAAIALSRIRDAALEWGYDT